MVEIYTDGSARNNGKENSSGGWGVVAIKDNKIIYFNNEQFQNVTNNRMELSAILHAFELTQTKYNNERCIVYTDSAYCYNIFNSWILAWKNNNWKRKGNKDIENLDLVKSLYKYLTIDFFNCQVKVEKVQGHSDNIYNNLADALATNNISKFHKIIKDNNLELTI